jgi:hypothetical protein
VLGRSPLPPAAATLGLELIDADVEYGTMEVALVATEDFVAPRATCWKVSRGDAP